MRLSKAMITSIDDFTLKADCPYNSFNTEITRWTICTDQCPSSGHGHNIGLYRGRSTSGHRLIQQCPGSGHGHNIGLYSGRSTSGHRLIQQCPGSGHGHNIGLYMRTFYQWAPSYTAVSWQWAWP